MKKYLALITCLVIVALSFVAGCQESTKTPSQPAIEEQTPPPAQPAKPCPVYEETKAPQQTEQPKVSPAVEQPAAEQPKTEKAEPAKEEKTTQAEVKAVPAAEPKTAAEPNAAPKNKDEGIEVTVNGTAVTTDQVKESIKRSLDQIDQQLPPDVRDLYKKKEIQKAVQNMIDQRLIDEQIKKAGIVITEQDVNDYINQKLADANMTMNQLVEKITADKMTYKEWKQAMQFPRMIGFEKLTEAQFVSGLKLEPNEVSDFYKQNPRYFQSPEQVEATHILVKTGKGIDPNQAKQQADDLLSQIKAGTSFDELAKKYTNTGAKDAPIISEQLGYFPRGAMAKPFEDAAFSMQPGQISDQLVTTQFGFHIIKVTGHKPAETVTLENASKEIENYLTAQKRQNLINDYKAKLRAAADIVYPPGKDPKDQRPMNPMMSARPGAARPGVASGHAPAPAPQPAK